MKDIEIITVGFCLSIVLQYKYNAIRTLTGSMYLYFLIFSISKEIQLYIDLIFHEVVCNAQIIGEW